MASVGVDSDWTVGALQRQVPHGASQVEKERLGRERRVFALLRTARLIEKRPDEARVQAALQPAQIPACGSKDRAEVQSAVQGRAEKGAQQTPFEDAIRLLHWGKELSEGHT